MKIHSQWVNVTVLKPQRSPDLGLIGSTVKHGNASDPNAYDSPAPKPSKRKKK